MAFGNFPLRDDLELAGDTIAAEPLRVRVVLKTDLEVLIGHCFDEAEPPLGLGLVPYVCSLH